MPYIEKGIRASVDSGRKPMKAGELNYAMSQSVKSYLAMRGESYQVYNDIIGVLECLKLELYRRKIGGYENLKLIENGDVW